MIKLATSCVQMATCTAWCNEIGSLTSLNAGAFGDAREPISLHQAVHSILFFVLLQSVVSILHSMDVYKGGKTNPAGPG